MKIYLETHGCTYNQADTNLMTSMLEEDYEIVNNLEESDVVILNTCYVKLPTEQKMIMKIRDIKENYPEKILIIAGCMVEVDPIRLNKFAPDNSWIGPHKIDKVSEIVEKSINGEIVQEYGKTDIIKAGSNKKIKDSIIHILQISEGCNGGCTFCCTKVARGNLVSYPTKDIVEEAKNALNKGAKELQVTAQDTACYGFDSEDSFANLLNQLSSLEGDFRIRVGMMHPKSLKNQVDEVVSAFKNSDKLFKFIHLPIQTGSDKVLKEMNRGNTISEFEDIINKFRKEIPDITIATDIIVGYPTETEEDFQKTLDLLKKVKPDVIHVSRYMHRPGAKSSSLQPVNHKVMKDRSHRLNEVKTQVMLEKNKQYEGSIHTALITSKGTSGGFAGYTDNYKNIIIDNATVGSFLKVKIIEGKRTYLLSEKI